MEVHGEAVGEEFGAEFLAERDDDPGEVCLIACVRTDLVADLRLVDILGFVERGLGQMLGGPRGDGGGGERLAASGLAVGLGDDGGDGVLGGEPLRAWEGRSAPDPK